MSESLTSDISLAYVVPTKDHPDDLRKMLDSLTKQTRLPDQIVIVDGSAPDVRHICDMFPELPLTYVRHYPPSLAAQRNSGMAAVRDDIDVAGYLDDDLVLEPDATERMVAFWRAAPADVGGASFSIINQPKVNNEVLARLFLMHGSPPGRVLSSGFPCQIPFVQETIQTEWLYGGATLWRRNVLREFVYDEWYVGYGYLEDLDYSYRVSRRYKLFVVGGARTWHFTAPTVLRRQFELGRQQTFNYLYFVRKMRSFSRLSIAWSLTGILILNTLALARWLDRHRLDRLRGNIVGLAAALAGRSKSYGGFWK